MGRLANVASDDATRLYGIGRQHSRIKQKGNDMAFKSETVKVQSGGERVPLATAPTMVKHLIVSPLQSNGGDVAIGDEGVSMDGSQDQGHRLRPDAPPLPLGSDIDLSEVFIYSQSGSAGVTLTYVVV